MSIAAKWRKASLVLSAVALAAALFLAVTWWAIHTQWFANLVRTRIVSAIQQASGGRVELASFSFDPEQLHAQISGLVVHGAEPAGSPPLLTVASASVGIKLLSVWKQDIDLQSVIIRRPQIFLLINSDGSSNIPTPRHERNQDLVEQLLDLKVKHFEVDEGQFQLNNKKFPFQFLSTNVGLALDYNHSGPSYGVALETGELTLKLRRAPLRPMHLIAKGRLFKDRADIEAFKLVTGKNSSTIDLTGKLEHFAQLTASANVDASLSMDELAQLAGNNQLFNGRATAKGIATFDAQALAFVFKGKTKVRGVDFVSPQFTLRNINAEANLVANNAGVLLQHAEALARGARFSGEGSIKAYRLLKVDGYLEQVALHEVGSYLTKQPFPWSGAAHGAAHATAVLTGSQPDLVISAQVAVNAGQTGIPTSGSVDITYRQRTSDVEFGDSNLQLPHSSLNFKGALSHDLTIKADSSDLLDLAPVLPILHAKVEAADVPFLQSGGAAHFNGVLHNVIRQATIQGEASANKFKFRNYDWDSFTGQIDFSASDLSLPHFRLQESGADLEGNASAQLTNWYINSKSPIALAASFSNLDVVKTAALFTSATLPVIQGIASGKVNLHGAVEALHGDATFQIRNLDAYGEQLNRIGFDAALDGNRLQVSHGRVFSGATMLTFSGSYKHRPNEWLQGNLDLKADTNGFPVASLSTVRKFVPALNARADLHLQASGTVLSNRFEPSLINGDAEFKQVTVNGREIGNASVKAVTGHESIDFNYTGNLREAKFHGAAQARLLAGTPVRGDIQIDRIGLATLKSLVLDEPLVLPVDGFADGSATFDGPLEEPERMHAQATIHTLQVSTVPRLTIAKTITPQIMLSNNEPIVIDVASGVLNVTKFEIDGRETSVKVTGTVDLLRDKALNIKAVGNADLALFTLFDPNVQSSGSSEMATDITGTLAAPNVTGALKLRNGSFFLNDISNGLSDVNGTVAFSRNRATIQKMSARSGGGDISLGGTLSFGAGTPLVYHLEGEARNVRVRYGNSISVTSNADLRLSGTSASSILSGMLTVTRVVFTPNADAGNLLAAATSSGSAPSDQGGFISGIHLDVGVESAPNLQVSTNLSRDVEAEIQLSLRGTPDHPIVLGNIAANQGDIKIFGTRFSLNRGEVSFVNTVRVEPVLDLDLETQARGVTVDITVSGTPGKLNFNYRSDPPLQPRDIIALLTVGRAPDVGTTSNSQSGSDVSALKSGVNSVLGQAISPVSNRLSKLFGITNIKIDPFVQGITNTPQARLSVEQQISRDVTIAYVTNLSQTSEQIFRFEWALNRQFSIVALRDDNGEFGIDFQYKKRFK